MSGGTAKRRAREGASPNSRWLVCSIATVNRTAASRRTTPMTIVRIRKSWFSRSRSCCARGTTCRHLRVRPMQACDQDQRPIEGGRLARTSAAMPLFGTVDQIDAGLDRVLLEDACVRPIVVSKACASPWSAADVRLGHSPDRDAASAGARGHGRRWSQEAPSAFCRADAGRERIAATAPRSTTSRVALHVARVARGSRRKIRLGGACNRPAGTPPGLPRPVAAPVAGVSRSAC